MARLSRPAETTKAEVSSQETPGTDPTGTSQVRVDGEHGSSAQPGMSEEQLEEVVRLLRAGHRLPQHLLANVAELPREYELAYRGKARRVDVLSDTMAMPLQAVKNFGVTESGWSNMLALGDNLQV